METKILAKKIAYKGKSIEVINQKTSITENSLEVTFEYVNRYNVALIIPILENGKIITVRQYRAAVDNFVLEFPAGKQKAGETTKETAIRELQEETGYFAEEIFLLNEFHIAPHFSTEKVFVYVAKQLKTYQTQAYSEHEFITQNTYHLSKLERAFNKEVIKDAKSIISLNYYRCSLNESEKINKTI